MDEIIEQLVIINKLGLHARPAAAIVNTMLPFKSDVRISVNGQHINAKSIMGLLTLAAAQGTTLTVICRGGDAEQAMTALRSLIEAGFGEE